MNIEAKCLAYAVDGFEKIFNFVLPESGIVPVSFPDASLNYATKPLERLNCS
jgi:hypothetical protein